MEYIYNKIVDILKLSDEIETGLGLKVKASEKTDSINGYINYNQGELKINFYDNDESPNEEHETTLVATILTDTQKTQLDTIISEHVI